MNQKIKLFGCADSPYVARVQWYLEEMGLSYEWINIDLMQNEQNSEQYLEKVPTGQVPSLSIDGKIIFDSNAILRLLSSMNGYKHYSEDLMKRAEIDSWTSFASDEVGEPISKLCWQRYWKKKLVNAEPDESYIKRLILQLEYCLPKLDKRLSLSQYLCGDFSLAEFSSFPLIVLAGRAQVNLDDYKNVTRWLSDIKKRPSFERVNYSY
jgi:glutathione S-transferase